MSQLLSIHGIFFAVIQISFQTPALEVNLFLLSFSLHFLLSPKLVEYLKTVAHLHFHSCLKASRGDRWQCVVFTLCLRASNHLDKDE